MTQAVSTIVAILIWGWYGGGSGLNILSSMNIRFVVVDPEGRRTGFDPASRTDLAEIPSSSYGEKYTGRAEGREGDRARSFVAAFDSPDGLIDGPYTIRVYGESAGAFWLSLSVYREPVSEDFNIRGFIRPGQLNTYRINYAGDQSVPITIDTLRSK
jgi:hypothetical protein